MESGPEEDFRPHKLMRCTSTPAHSASNPSLAPSRKFACDVSQQEERDSGLGTDLSTTSSSPSLPNQFRRIRTRSISGSSSSQDSLFLTPDPVPFSKRRQIHSESLRSRDLHIPNQPKDGEDGDRSRASSTSSSGSRRVFFYSPGLFCGREKLDIIRRLSDMQAGHLLDHIWMELSVEDLSAAMQVSSLWNATVKSSSPTHKRWSEAREAWTENDSGPGSRTRLRKSILLKSSPRKALGNVSNYIWSNVSPKGRAASATVTSITSPSKFRHGLFAEEASRLNPGEQLRSCPRCTSPSKVNLEEMRAECTRISCQFVFCTRCMCEFHKNGAGCRVAGAKSLTFSSKPKKVPNSSNGKSRSNIISSGKSKSRLKRL